LLSLYYGQNNESNMMADTRAVETHKYTLPREMDLLAAEALKGVLVDMLDQDGGLALDASEVERVSTPCIEVLVAAEVAFGKSGQKFEMSAPSPPLCDALEALGLVDRIEKWRAS